MIGYVTVGTNDIDRAAKFYDALFGSLGAGRFFDTDTVAQTKEHPACA